MKKILSIIIFFALTVLLTNCANDRNLSADLEITKEPHFLYANEGPYLNGFEFGAKDDKEYSIEVTAVDVNWAFTGMASWLIVNPSSGNTDKDVSVTAEYNPSGEDIRSTVFSIAATDNKSSFTREFSASQVADKPYIIASPDEISMPGSAGTHSSWIDANVEWYVTDVRYPSSNKTKDWITVTKKQDNGLYSGLLNFSVLENTSNEQRSANISVYRKSTDTYFTTIYLFQSPANVSVQTEALNYDFNGGGYELTLNSEAAWTAETSDSWIDVSPASGDAGESKIIISTVPNNTSKSLAGYVYIKIGGNIVASIPVNQGGIELSVDNTNNKLSYTAGGGKLRLNVSSNTDWVVKQYPSWVTVSNESGSKNSAIEVTAEPNNSLEKRTGTLKLAVEGTNVYKYVKLEQDGWKSEDFYATLNFNAMESNDTLAIKANGDWSISTELDWVTFSKSSGTNDYDLVITASENLSDNARSGFAYLTIDGTVNIVYIEQAAKFFTVSPTQATLPSKGGTHRVQISTNDNWTASTNSTWMTLSQSSGYGDIDVVLTAAENPSVKERTDTTVFQSLTLKQPIKVITKQDGKYLSVNAKSIGFFRKGGESSYYQIETDANYTITADQSWINLSHDAEGKMFKVSVNENTERENRKGNVVITMTGLPDGESCVLKIPVVQYGTAQTIVVTPFEPDDNWNFSGDTGLKIKVTGFGTDEDWNF